MKITNMTRTTTKTQIKKNLKKTKVWKKKSEKKK